MDGRKGKSIIILFMLAFLDAQVYRMSAVRLTNQCEYQLNYEIIFQFQMVQVIYTQKLMKQLKYYIIVRNFEDITFNDLVESLFKCNGYAEREFQGS